MPSHKASERTLSRGLALGLVALVLGATAVGCTGGDDESGDPDESSPTPTEVPAATLEIRVDKVAGELTRAVRSRIAQAIEETLQGYLDGALLGDYPRTEFALTGFTRGAEQQAEADLELLTGRAFADAESVTATALAARLSVLAPEGRPAGATARIRFALDVDGQPVKVTGRLLLTPDEGTWRIFGYDIASDIADFGATTGGEG